MRPQRFVVSDGLHADIGAHLGCRTPSQCRIGGLVVARQRPGTAKGCTFMLIEDEYGTVNVIVSPQIYERDRLVG